MTENMKNLLEIISANKDLCAEFESIANSEDKAAANEAILQLSAKVGIPLSEADLELDEALDLNELDAVAGGGVCVCVAGGGGKVGESDWDCACVVYGSGQGYQGDDTIQRCVCAIGGGGSSLD